MLQEHNSLVVQFKQKCDIPPNEVAEFEIVFKIDGQVDRRRAHPGRYNVPRTTEVAAFMPGGENEQFAPMQIQGILRDPPPTEAAQGRPHDVAVRAQAGDGPGNVVVLSESHPFYEPLHFVFFYPYGSRGWSWDMKSANGKRLTLRDYTAFFMHQRDPPDNSLFLYGGKLYQEWLVAMHSRIENLRLGYIRKHQQELRATSYSAVARAVQDGHTDAANLGTPYILPSSFVASPRYMQQCYQDAMAVVRHHGKPDLFVTITCNPKWPEIQDQLKPGEAPADRPDIVARVFRLKLNALLKDLEKGEVFGRPCAIVHVVEYQKRGLPHAHILVILKPEHKIRTTQEIDSIVCAEIPKMEDQPELYRNVSAHMLHGPCGSINPEMVCMEEGNCSKEFPKPFQAETVNTGDGYPKYKRSQDGPTIQKSVIFSTETISVATKFLNFWAPRFLVLFFLSVQECPWTGRQYDLYIRQPVGGALQPSPTEEVQLSPECGDLQLCCLCEVHLQVYLQGP